MAITHIHIYLLVHPVTFILLLLKYIQKEFCTFEPSSLNINNMRPSFNCCSCSFCSSSPCLQNIVKGLRQFLLERLSVRFKQQVLIDEEPREDYADEFNKLESTGGLRCCATHHRRRSSRQDQRHQRHRGWLLFRIVPLFVQRPRDFLQFILNLVASRRRVHSRVRFLNRHGGRFELFPHEGCSSQGV